MVLGTSVTEVGRDHDYDWAIAEPSSLRSLIQLAGRIQRHRQQAPQQANLLVFNKNIRALKNQQPAYCQPGFESKQLPLADHDLQNLISDELSEISALPRICEPAEAKDFLRQKSPAHSFATQEHRALIHQLFTNELAAKLWWQDEINIHWHGELIRKTPFRQNQPEEAFVLHWPEDEALQWAKLDDSRWPAVWQTQNSRFKLADTPLANGVSWWFQLELQQIYSHYAEAFDKTEQQVSEEFGTIRLRAAKEGQELFWYWHPMLGVFQEFNE